VTSKRTDGVAFSTLLSIKNSMLTNSSFYKSMPHTHIHSSLSYNSSRQAVCVRGFFWISIVYQHVYSIQVQQV